MSKEEKKKTIVSKLEERYQKMKMKEAIIPGDSYAVSIGFNDEDAADRIAEIYDGMVVEPEVGSWIGNQNVSSVVKMTIAGEKLEEILEFMVNAVARETDADPESVPVTVINDVTGDRVSRGSLSKVADDVFFE